MFAGIFVRCLREWLESENGTMVTAADLSNSSGDSRAFFGRCPLDSRERSLNEWVNGEYQDSAMRRFYDL